MSVYVFLIVPPSNESPFDIVDAKYIAERTGLSERTILDGKGGVKEIPRARRKPAGWFRHHVDAWLKKRSEQALSPKQKAHRLLQRKPRRKSAA